MVFAYGAHHAILDGNVKRVLARACGIEGYPGDKAVAEALWQEKHLPIILISAHSDLDLLSPEHEPIACCMRKPISIDDLERAIATALAK